MPHPFFDVGRFPWSRDEAVNFHRELSNNIPLPGRISLIFQSAGGSVASLNLGQTPALIWHDVIDQCAAQNLLRQLFQRLAEQAEWPQLESFVTAIESAVDLLDVKVLTNERIFVDRKNLRAEIVKLCGTAASHGVLLVRGESGSGKSWTKYFIEDLARGLGAECVYLFEGYVADVDAVLDQLFAALGNSAAKPTVLETTTAFYMRVCNKLQETAIKQNKQLWVVVDDLGAGPDGAPLLDKEILAFFNQFGLSMANPSFAKWFRLVLLDYPDTGVPTKWKDVWVEDRTAPGEADTTAVSQFLEQWAARKNKKIVAADAKKFVDDVVAKVDTPPAPGAIVPPRMLRLQTELASALKKL